MSQKRVLTIVLLMALSSHAMGYVLGGTNLGISGYPEPSCMKPLKPIKPYSLDNQWEVNSYNSQVDIYNSQMQMYISCLKEYLDNASNDMKRIKEKMEEAVSAAKSPSY